MKRFKNTSDQPEFWRKIAALKNDFIQIDTTNSIIQMSKDQQVTTIESTADFTTDTKTNESIEINRKATLVTIPIDLRPNSVSNTQKLIQSFPKSLQDLTADELIYLALMVYKQNDLYFNDEEKNKNIINKAIKCLRYNPFDSGQYWPEIDSRFLKTFRIDKEILRPYKIIAGKPWQEDASESIGHNRRFLSYFKHIADFVIQKEKIPTVNEFILYIYAREIIGKDIEITFKTEFDKKNDRDSLYFNRIKRTNASKLESDVLETAKMVIEIFEVASEDLKIKEMIRRLEIKKTV